MIPIIQFDPASLTIWYDTHLIARMRGSEDIGTALDLALRGDDDRLASHVKGIGDKWVSMRAATIAAACWHEKRHFLDFVLTNYGALRVRQFFMVYLNLPAVFNAALENRELLVPLQSYREKLFCETMGVKAVDLKIMAVASEIRNRKLMLDDDRQLIDSRVGLIEIGGELILETIAHYIQTAKTERLLGLKYTWDVQKDLPDDTTVSSRYTWAYKLMISAGLIEQPSSEGEFVVIRDAPVLPICYAALAQRAWKQEQTWSEGVSSFHPSERLGSLVIALRDNQKQLQGADLTGCWEIVNKVAKNLFGRSVIDEMEADIELEEKFIKSVSTTTTERMGLQAFEDFHALRVKLFKEFKTDPCFVIDQRKYNRETDRRIKPFIIVAATGGGNWRPASRL